MLFRSLSEFRAQATTWLLVANAWLILYLVACGTATSIELEALLASSPSQAVELFADDAVYVDPNGVEYVGKSRILGPLTEAREVFDDSAVVVEPPHPEGDHIAWTRITTSSGPNPPAGTSFVLQQSMWSTNGKITRVVATATARS